MIYTAYSVIRIDDEILRKVEVNHASKLSGENLLERFNGECEVTLLTSILVGGSDVYEVNSARGKLRRNVRDRIRSLYQLKPV